MNANIALIPVEYIITTTSDWTMLKLVDGGTWQNIQVFFKEGENQVVQKKWDSKSIYIEKKSYDETPVVVEVKCILSIPKECNELQIKYRIEKGDIQSTVVTTIVRGRKHFVMVNKKGDGSEDGSNPMIFSSSTSEYSLDLRKEKVFIVHGRDRLQALLLSDYLNKRGINAVMFEDLTHYGKTIIEQIEHIRDSVAYAFIILTPDDVGCLSDDINRFASDIATSKTIRREEARDLLTKLQHRARQNVIFEFGMFVGALGRENVCILKQKGVKEIPTDINAVLYNEFDKEVSEVFHKLHDELGV
jgi:predicted nucleotide-binding protein